MTEQQGTAVALRIEGVDEILWAEARPEDEDHLQELLGGGPIAVSLNEDGDTEGHTSSPEVILDVEGHAIALRLPTAADAATLRRGFALGAVTASLVIGGAAAAVTGADLVSRAAAEPAAAGAPAAADSVDSSRQQSPKQYE